MQLKKKERKKNIRVKMSRRFTAGILRHRTPPLALGADFQPL